MAPPPGGQGAAGEHPTRFGSARLLVWVVFFYTPIPASCPCSPCQTFCTCTHAHKRAYPDHTSHLHMCIDCRFLSTPLMRPVYPPPGPCTSAIRNSGNSLQDFSGCSPSIGGRSANGPCRNAYCRRRAGRLAIPSASFSFRCRSFSGSNQYNVDAEAVRRRRFLLPPPPARRARLLRRRFCTRPRRPRVGLLLGRRIRFLYLRRE